MSRADDLLNMIHEMTTVTDRDHHLGSNIRLNILQGVEASLQHGARIKIYKAGTNPKIKGQAYVVKLPEGTLLHNARHDYDFLNTQQLGSALKHIKRNSLEYMKLWNDASIDVIDLELK